MTDNGIGMPAGSDAPKAGLGTGIVEALVKNMQGEIQQRDADPGTAVTISHREGAGSRADFDGRLGTVASEALSHRSLQGSRPSRSER